VICCVFFTLAIWRRISRRLGMMLPLKNSDEC
jgi:hypothetical protein